MPKFLKRLLTVIILFCICLLSGCKNKQGFNIYIGEDGYWYINDIKTDTYSIGEDGKSAYEIALENGYNGTFEEWLNKLTKGQDTFKINDIVNKYDITGSIEILNGQILLIAEYVEKVEIKEGVVQEIAYEGNTLYDIFVTNNYAPGNMDRLQSSNETYANYSGTVTLQSEVYNSYNKAMYVTGTTSQQVKSSKEYTGEFYIASKLMCTRYEKGYLGIVFGSDSNRYLDTTIQEVTNEFVTRSAIETLENENIFIGSCISASLDGYIDDAVVVDLSMFEEVPTIEKLDSLYERYVQILKGEIETTIRYEYVNRRDTFYLGGTEKTYSDKEAKATFMQYMNDKAKEIGMENTTFIDAAGFYNRTTAYDLLRMGVYACGYDEIVETWHKNSYTISVGGYTPRNVSLTTTVKGADLEDYYFLFGGKTGTVDGQSNLLAIVEGPDERLFVVVVLGAEINRFAAAKQAMDAAVAKYYDPNIDNSSFTVEAKSAAVCLLPKNNTLAYTDYDLNILYEKDIYTSRTPASITKVMTSICMLDYVNDIHQEFTIIQSDITSGSGNYFRAGDKLSYYEALHAMLLPSSNTCAEATATAVGHIMLKYKDQ